MIRGHKEIRAEYSRSDIAADYIDARFKRDPFGRHTHLRQVQLLHQLWPRIMPQRILEIAPGPARLTVDLPAVAHVYAVEQSQSMIEIAEERLARSRLPHWNLIRGDAFALPIGDALFDTVLSFRFLRHFDRANRARLLSEFRRTLKPGGHLILDVANATMYRWLLNKIGVAAPVVEDYWFSETDFRAEMQENRFHVQELHAVHAALPLQHYLFCYVAPRGEPLARTFASILDTFVRRKPLEWVALCRYE